MDVILLRQDPPFDMNYITTTHILERIHPKTLVVNDPAWVRNSAGKDLRHRIPRPDAGDADHPDPQRGRRLPQGAWRHHRQAALRQWRRRHLPSHATTTATSPRCSKCSAQMFREPFIVQRYLKDVRKGDKRIILIDGEPVGAINRVPAEHDSRSNMHVGGRAEKTELTDARARNLRPHRPVAARARLHPRRHRRDRRLHDRDQRDLADRRARGEALRRRRYRGAVLGCGGSAKAR